MKEKFRKVLEKLKDLKILVVGDLILDRYIFGTVERISPEAPVPVVEVEREEFRLGGAANVANNLSSLGVKTYLVGITGSDYGKHILKGLIRSAFIEDLTLEDSQRPTTEKTRVVSMSQQLLRIDWEDRKPISGRVLEKLLERLDVEVDGVILSDYAKGVVCEPVVKKLKEKEVFLSVDPRPVNKSLYYGADLMTPNEKEARQMAEGTSLESLGWTLKKELNLKTLVITLGPKGMALFDKEYTNFPARAKQVYDVSGAGDTVVAVLTASYLASGDWYLACELANLCAGIVVGKLGTASITLSEILNAIEER
ncbi:PfkB family carbohydrate kinase [Thermocrinis sp.]|uniref:bifunctional heptose 7-phosphate kinase/heptose 1-phosphate adenyltransferase n=1 Tax=Thermocrinis sp. TaxID=2024383 RepID=UPI002FDE6F14